MSTPIISDIDVQGLRVLIRVDFNVPLSDGTITDDRRIRMALPTIQSVLNRGGRAILLSHLGRPAGKGFEEELCMEPVAAQLKTLLPDRDVTYVGGDCASDESLAAANALTDGQVLLLENARFNPGEKGGDAGLGEQLARMADVYCNDAFGTAHRSDASMVALPRAMTERPRVAGLLMAGEMKYPSETIENAERPFVAILGGAKVSDKLAAIENLIGRVDSILIGGAMAYTFLAAADVAVGASLVEPDRYDDARAIRELASARGTTLMLPTDHVCASEIESSAAIEVSGPGIPVGQMGLDIGPETYTAYVTAIRDARTVVWNGPMGVFETPPFDVGTRRVAEAVADATRRGAISVIGGGDSAAAISRFGLDDDVSHVSTGGGASLRMLEGAAFESVEALGIPTRASAP